MKHRQRLHGAAEKLFDYSGTIPVIDTHEHIPRREADYNATTIQFGQLFNPYASNDLASAGMPFPRDQWAAFVCIGDDWDAFEPYWRQIRHGSYARPIRIALQEFYGVDDLTRDDYLDIVQRINAGNTPGVYDRIIRQKCNIERVITCAPDMPDRADPLLVGNVSSPSMMAYNAESMRPLEAFSNGPIRSLDQLVEACDRHMEAQAAAGAVQFKTTAMPECDASRGRAAEVLAAQLRGDPMNEMLSAPLRVFLREENARKAGELGLPLAVHTGVWNDYRNNLVTEIVGMVARHPGTLFDVYHLGIPRVREALQLVKNFPNAFLNLCWAHIVAPEATVQALREALDMVPVNKVFAFGGDYVYFIEKIYGHLWMARENVAIALGERVDRGLMDMDEARDILKAWFYDNPKRFYRLGQPRAAQGGAVHDDGGEPEPFFSSSRYV